MSLSKAVLMGKVVRSPEKRYTSNNVPITSFSIDISNNETPSLVRIFTKGKLAETTADSVKKDNIIVIEGRLQTNVFKTNNGQEKKGVEVDAMAVEVVGTSAQPSSTDTEDLFNYDDVNADDLIGEDEIPF